MLPTSNQVVSICQTQAIKLGVQSFWLNKCLHLVDIKISSLVVFLWTYFLETASLALLAMKELNSLGSDHSMSRLAKNYWYWARQTWKERRWPQPHWWWRSLWGVPWCLQWDSAGPPSWSFCPFQCLHTWMYWIGFALFAELRGVVHFLKKLHQHFLLDSFYQTWLNMQWHWIQSVWFVSVWRS